MFDRIRLNLRGHLADLSCKVSCNTLLDERRSQVRPDRLVLEVNLAAETTAAYIVPDKRVQRCELSRQFGLLD